MDEKFNIMSSSELHYLSTILIMVKNLEFLRQKGFDGSNLFVNDPHIVRYDIKNEK